MDEPLAALDLKRKQEVLPYLERLHDELEIPVLYVSHAPDEVARIADHIVVMDGGRVTAAGPLEETLARIDLPIRLGEDVGVVLNAIVSERDTAWGLARMDFVGGVLWTRDPNHPIGRRVRVRVLARDVSLAREQQKDSSILNCLPGIVDAVSDEEHPGLALVRVNVGETIMIARVTKRSAASLGIIVGGPIWVQVKSVALLD
jgi:molybdate transport system ATP-binding protein